jgi:hypothetical protein
MCVFIKNIIIFYKINIMTTTTDTNGRLGNQIIRNLAVSFIAKKHNLNVKYSNYYLISSQLGIDLFIGTQIYSDIKELNDYNYFDIYNTDIITYNLNPNNCFFQTKEINNMIYDYLHSDIIKSNIIKKNKFKERYNNNNDLFIHIRLGDIAHFNPGIEYYLKSIKFVKEFKNFNDIYIASDTFTHNIIKKIIEKYPNANLIDYNEIDTIQFGSTCKNIILSHGSFSAIIGNLSFYSNVYYPKIEKDKRWYGDMFSIQSWTEL